MRSLFLVFLWSIIRLDSELVSPGGGVAATTERGLRGDGD